MRFGRIWSKSSTTSNKTSWKWLENHPQQSQLQEEAPLGFEEQVPRNEQHCPNREIDFGRVTQINSRFRVGDKKEYIHMKKAKYKKKLQKIKLKKNRLNDYIETFQFYLKNFTEEFKGLVD